MNLYAYTKQEFIDLTDKYGGLFVKVGCSTRDPLVRIKEQQSTSDATAPIVVGTWLDTQFDSDKEIHSKLKSIGCRSSKLNGAGTEWFLIPEVTTPEMAKVYLNAVVGQAAAAQTSIDQGMRIFSGEGQGITKLITKFFEWISLFALGGDLKGKRGYSTWNYVKHTRGMKIRRD